MNASAGVMSISWAYACEMQTVRPHPILRDTIPPNGSSPLQLGRGIPFSEIPEILVTQPSKQETISRKVDGPVADPVWDPNSMVKGPAHLCQA